MYLNDELHVLRVCRGRLQHVYLLGLVLSDVHKLPFDVLERCVVVAAALVRREADLLRVRVRVGVGVRVRGRVRVGVGERP